MSDYIRRKTVTVGLDYIINELNKLITDDSPNDGYTDIKNQVEEIKRGVLNIPSEDVQPVVHGEWINAYPDIEPNPMLMYGICSVCGCEQSISDKLNYCPVCGAKMDEKERENEVN